VDPASNTCMLEVRLTSEGVKYHAEPRHDHVRRRERPDHSQARQGTILAELKKDGPCLSAETKPAKAPSK
jgi:hypothetical protein